MDTKIKEARKAAGLSQEELAERTGLSQQSVSRWEKGDRRPQMESLRIIAEACNTTVDYLLGLTENPGKVFEQSLPHGIIPISEMPHHTLPMFGTMVSGKSSVMNALYDAYVESVCDADFVLTVSGASMAPNYLDGDVVYVRSVPDVDDGQVCVVAVDEDATLIHLYHIPGGVQLISDNPAFKPMIFTADNSAHVRVLGVPVGYTRMYKKPIKNE